MSRTGSAFFLATAVCAWSISGAAKAAENIAVIVGNANYGPDIPDIAYAGRDAEAIKAWLIGVQGYKANNIIDIRDATKAQMEATFGSATNPRGRLWRYADPADGGAVFVYYSGHGVPGISDRKRYLLPVDTEPDFADVSGYPVSQLLENLKDYRSATVILDACFSGSSAGGTLFPSSSGIRIMAKNESPSDSLTVLTAAGPGQLASWDHRSQHGLFTEYFLRGVYGEADLDLDGQIKVGEVKSFMDANMTRVARRTYGREQDASLLGQEDRILATFNPWAKPPRPRVSTKPYRDKPAEISKPVVKPSVQQPRPPVASQPPRQPVQVRPAAKSESTTDLVLRTILKGLEVYLVIKKIDRWAVSRSRIPVRFSPGQDARQLGWVDRGQGVHVTGRVDGTNWLRVNFDEQQGYVRANGLARLLPGEFDRWERAVQSGRAKDYRKYLQKYPRGYFARSARAKLK